MDAAHGHPQHQKPYIVSPLAFVGDSGIREIRENWRDWGDRLMHDNIYIQLIHEMRFTVYT